MLPEVLARATGLRPMTRQHVHFATAPIGEAKSGMRSDAAAVVDLDVALALAAGMRLGVSSNDVGLTAGLTGAACGAGEAVVAAWEGAGEVPLPVLEAAAAAAAAVEAAAASGEGDDGGRVVPWWTISGVRRAADGAVIWRRGWPIPDGLVPGAGAPEAALAAAREAALSHRAAAKTATKHKRARKEREAGAAGAAASSERRAAGASAAAASSSSSAPSRATVPGRAAPDVLLVLDFEATCAKGIRLSPQEVIELPTVAVDVVTGAVLAEYRTYVRPTHHPVLSDFCTSLTGIEQPTVDAAPAWPQALASWSAWAAGNGWVAMDATDEEVKAAAEAAGGGAAAGTGDGSDKSPGDASRAASIDWAFGGDGGSGTATVSRLRCARPGRALVVTCGDWDLKTMLPVQAAASPAPVPPLMMRWTNLKFAFSSAFRSPGRHSMLTMLARAGLKQRGRHHSGLDDCRNLAAVAGAILERQGPAPFSKWTNVTLRA